MIDVAQIIEQSVAPVRKVGIYFLIKREKVVYVGRSTNIETRVLSHARGKYARDFDAWSWVPCDACDLDATEEQYIRAIRPAWNIFGVTARFCRHSNVRAGRAD